jgi:ADP-ribose pyrophosphatase
MKIDNIKRIAGGNYLNFFGLEGHGKSGSDQVERNFTWEFFSRKKEIPKEPDDKKSQADAVVVVALHTDEDRHNPKIVLVKQFRPPIRDFVYELPAGIIDPGENAEQAARRELKEETGLDATEILNQSPKVYNSPGCTDESCCIITLACEGKLSTNNIEDNESIIPMLLSPKELIELMETKPVMGAKCWLTIHAITPMLMHDFEK